MEPLDKTNRNQADEHRKTDDAVRDAAPGAKGPHASHEGERLSAPRRFLQVCSILLFAAAGLAIVYAVLLIASGGTPSPLLAALGGDVLDRTTATATGLGLIVLGVVDIIIGIVGLMGVRHPEKAMPILVISVLESAMSAYGCLTAFSYGNLISTVFCLAMAVSAWVVYSERKRTAR